MKSKLTEKSERYIIEHISDLLGLSSDKHVIKGIGDDCAVLRKDNKKCFLVTTDTLVEGVHFDLAWHPPFLLGRKTAAVNISDIAAMGGQPRFALLSMAFPVAAPAWLDEFLAGFIGMLQEYDIHLVGGDTVKSPNDISITVTVIGEAAEGTISYRAGAVCDDLVFVSGALGNAAAGLALCRAGIPDDGLKQWQQLVGAHLDPQPQVQLGIMLAESGLVHAMMDISDGLATDLSHICTESGTGAEIIKEKLPISEELKSAAGKLVTPVLDWILKGGEDYQLLFIIPPEHEQDVCNLVREKKGQEIFSIGKIIESPGIFLVDGLSRKDVAYQGYDHFRDRKR